MMKTQSVYQRNLAIAVWIIICFSFVAGAFAQTYVIVDTGQTECYDDLGETGCPQAGEAFFGQDARYDGVQPAYQDNGDGTVGDLATGLMWQQDDSGAAMDWQGALSYAEDLTLAGYDDWRLPNAKELQGIVDYTRSPATTASAAIDPVFGATVIIDEGGQTNYPFYWTSTTHVGGQSSGTYAAYIAFGEALGFMEMPPDSGNYNLVDVHGAGAQRSDPKSGDPADWPYGHGPQGDVIRIYHHVRCVRDAEPASLGACGDDDHPYPRGDINGDCYVNMGDVAELAGNWLACTHPQPPCNYQPPGN